MKPIIGFIGLGKMGFPMSQNLIKANYRLVVYDIKESAMEPLVKAGATKALNPSDVAKRSSVVITMLPASSQVEATVLGPAGVIEGISAGNILIDMGSSYPGSTKMISERL